jgi:hypothetical protein
LEGGPEASSTGPTVQLRSGPLPPPEEKPYNPEKDREKWRGPLAAAMVAILAGTIFLAFVAIALHWATEQETKDLIVAIFPPEVALTGTALGFYFGGQPKS